jgi:enoyl-CoA hydratase
MSELVTYRLHNSVATITMDDGKANVLSPAMQTELNRALDRAIADKAVVALAGRPGTFSGGFDLKILSGHDDIATQMVRGGFDLALRLLNFPTPVIIACTGHALAMGSFLLLAADYRIGIAGPFKIGANEVAIGLTMPRFAVELCRGRLQSAHLHRAVVTAEIFSPESAAAAGFFDRVVNENELANLTRNYAEHLAELDMQAYVATKARVRETWMKTLRQAFDADETGVRNQKRK